VVQQEVKVVEGRWILVFKSIQEPLLDHPELDSALL
jgi:hypothetical protein